MSESPQTPVSSRSRSDPSEPLISVQDLVVQYGDHVVLNHLNLDIYPGETMVILGGSGSGKSTLLRQMEALERPSSGKVIVKGVDVASCPEAQLNEVRRIMGVSFQSAAMFNSMTLAENVALPLREHTKLADSTIQLITRMKLEQVGLANSENLYPSQLSGGMRKRASVARAMAMDPEILFFDEPSAGLDPIIAAGIDELILHLQNAFKMTIVIVTHELASAFLIADRMCFLHEGTMIAIGTRDEITSNDHPRIRQFLERIPDHMIGDEKTFLERLTRR